MKLDEVRERVQKLYGDNFDKTQCAIIADTWAILDRENQELLEKLKKWGHESNCAINNGYKFCDCGLNNWLEKRGYNNGSGKNT